MPTEVLARNLRTFRDVAAVNPHLLADLQEHKKFTDQANASAISQRIIAIPQVSVSNVFSLAQWQTPIKDQGQRGTCYAFAAVAALEAAYKRQYGLTLDLSEQYTFHINKASELYGDYTTNNNPHENNSSLWGFQGASDIADKMTRFAIPSEADCPYLSAERMDAIRAATPGTGTLSDNADSISTQEMLDAFEFSEQHIPSRARGACRYRINTTAGLPGNPAVTDIQKVISAGHEVIADIPGHCFLIIGYDNLTKEFIVKNSWGGTDYLRYPFSDPILGGRYITSIHPPSDPPQKKAFWMGRWNMDHDGWRGTLVIRRWTDYRHGDGDPTKVGNYYRDGKRYDVNGITFDDGQKLACWIADTTNRVTPGQSSGQPFNVFVYSNDAADAAGLTRWNNVDYGVTLRRGALTPFVSMKPFDENEWIGNWAMNHDGWKGQLDISSVRPLRATYRDANGSSHPVAGSLDGAQPHILTMTITFAANNVQPFRLALSTWEKKVFAGTTSWGGREFGVQGERQDRFAVYGAIRAKWVAAGAFAGFLGQPQTDETGTPDGRGRFNHFQGGSIYWTPQTGAQLIYGMIRDKWASMGWERSHLGYPTSDEKDWPGAPGGRCSDFEHGRIVWDPHGGAREG